MLGEKTKKKCFRDIYFYFKFRVIIAEREINSCTTFMLHLNNFESQAHIAYGICFNWADVSKSQIFINYFFLNQDIHSQSLNSGLAAFVSGNNEDADKHRMDKYECYHTYFNCAIHVLSTQKKSSA